VSESRCVPSPADNPAFLRALVDHSNDVLFVMDASGTLTYASRAAARVLGLDPDEYVGTNALELVHPDDAGEAAEALGRSRAAAAAGAGALPIKNIRVRRGDGTYRWFELESYSLLDDPDVRGFVVSGRDVTDRYEQAEQIRSNEERYRALFESSLDAIMLVDTETFRIVDANPAAKEIYGWTRAELLAMKAHDLSTEPEATKSAISEASARPRMIERMHCRRDGTPFPVEIGYSVADFDGRRLVVASIRDVTERVEATRERSRAEAEFRTLVAASSDIITVLEADGTWRWSSAAGLRTLGYAPGYDPPGGIFSLLVPEDVPAALEAFDEVRHGKRGPEPLVLRVRTADGSIRHLETVARDLTDDPAVRGIVLNSRDVTDRVVATEALTASEQRFRLLVTHASDLITTFAADGLCTYASPAITTLFGYEPHEIVGTQARNLMHPDEITRVEETIERQFTGAEPKQPIKYLMLHRDGSWRHVETVVTNLLYEPTVEAVVCNTRDVTALEAARDLLEYQAMHDPLTGLPNRRQFSEIGRRALAQGELDGSSVGVLFVDLDGFKQINDSLGHEAGDAALEEVARRLRATARANDTLARLGGDEFCVLCEGLHSESELRTVAERVVAAITEPSIDPAQGIVLGASVGAVIAEAKRTRTIEGLLREADNALYRAKRAGGGRIESVVTQSFDPPAP
jgi:diguanylate cyclase (GGDEF)-like protein/PAS domain S-box-containing protein